MQTNNYRPDTAPARRRHSGSDGLRVIAMLGVAAFHIRPDAVPAGFLGVVIFLVLAGYYTTRSFTVRPNLRLGPYYGKKITKLWPPLLFVMVLVGLFSAFLLPEVFGFFRESAPSAALGWHNIAEVFKDRSYFARHGSFDPLVHLWAMSLEMQYYLLFPLLYLLLSKMADNLPRKLRLYGREIAGFILLALSIVATMYQAFSFDPAGDPTPYYYNSFMRSNAFLLGAACCLIAAGRQMRVSFLIAAGRMEKEQSFRMPKWLRAILTWICLVLLIGAFFIFDASSAFLYRGGFWLYSFIATAFILLGGIKPVAGMGFLDTGVFRYLASRSYHIYLWQYSIMVLLEAGLRFSTLSFWPRLAIQIVLVLMMSELSYRIFDRKGLRQGVKAYFSAVLALILFTLLILPPQVQPDAPSLQGDAVLEAIRENESVQASLAAAEEAEPEKESKPEESNMATETTTPLPSATEDLLEKNLEIATEDNPYGYSKSACEVLDRLNLVIVGDSVMAMAMNGIRAYVPRVYIDAAVSRHFFQGPSIVETLDASGIRGDIIVIALSTNGDIQEGDIDYFAKLADDRPIIFVNTVVPGSWEQPNNNKLAAAAQKYSNVFVADWYSRAKNVPEYFYQDATHPVPLGADVYDQVILETVLQVISEGKYTLNPPIHFPPSPPVTAPTNNAAPDPDSEPGSAPEGNGNQEEPAAPSNQPNQPSATPAPPTQGQQYAPTAAPSEAEAPTADTITGDEYAPTADTVTGDDYAPTAPPAN